MSERGTVSIQQVIAEVSAIERAISDQLQVIDGFTRRNAENIQLVNTFLRGSLKAHDKSMLAALAEADSKLTEARAELDRALTALQRVQMI